MTTVSEKEQWDVIEKISVFEKMAGQKCSAVLTPFLCFSLAPKCREDIMYPIKPCREACLKVKVNIVIDILSTNTINYNTEENLLCYSTALENSRIYLKSGPLTQSQCADHEPKPPPKLEVAGSIA